MKATHRIVLVDDHDFVRRSIRRLLETESDFTVCAEASNRAETLHALRLHRPDLLILDLVLPGEDGLAFVSEIRRQHPDLLILILSLHKETLFAEPALRAGADGYLMKNDAPERLVEAIHTLLDHRLYLSPQVQQLIFSRLRGGDRNAPAETRPLTGSGARARRPLFRSPASRKPVRTSAR